jgi:hypothetical protein
MKPFVTRVCAKVSRFFWSWGFLKFVLLAVTLIVLLYAEENWRGARAWATTKAYWEAKGETFDINRLAPPPVPDDENLAALPIFKMEPDPDPGDKGNPVPLALRRAFTYDTDQEFPRGGSWELGKLADEKKNRADVAAMYAKVFGAAATGKDSLTQFDELFPAIAKLRDTAAARRYCRFEQFYSFDTPYNFSLLTSQIMVSKFISADAILALEGKKPDIVLGDIETNFKLRRLICPRCMRASLLMCGTMPNSLTCKAIWPEWILWPAINVPFAGRRASRLLRSTGLSPTGKNSLRRCIRGP